MSVCVLLVPTSFDVITMWHWFLVDQKFVVLPRFSLLLCRNIDFLWRVEGNPSNYLVILIPCAWARPSWVPTHPCSNNYGNMKLSKFLAAANIYRNIQHTCSFLCRPAPNYVIPCAASLGLTVEFGLWFRPCFSRWINCLKYIILLI